MSAYRCLYPMIYDIPHNCVKNVSTNSNTTFHSSHSILIIYPYLFPCFSDSPLNSHTKPPEKYPSNLFPRHMVSEVPKRYSHITGFLKTQTSQGAGIVSSSRQQDPQSMRKSPPGSVFFVFLRVTKREAKVGNFC